MPAARQSDRPYSGMTLPELRRALDYALRRHKDDRAAAIEAELDLRQRR